MVSSGLLRDRLLARMREAGGPVDHQQLAAEVLGIRGAPPDLARKLVAQALVLEDRRDAWRRTGERICRDAPTAPGVYILKDEDDRAVYVGKAVNLRRRLRAHFAERRWRATKADLARVTSADWTEVGSELEALLREAALIAELQPIVNVQIAAPAFETRAIPLPLIRDTVVLLPSVESDSVELIAARVDGGWMIQRTRRSGADLAVHTQRLWKFFFGAFRRAPSTQHIARGTLHVAPSTQHVAPSTQHVAPCTLHLAPIVFSWLAKRGVAATRIDIRAMANARDLRMRLAALLRDVRLFHERLEQC
jgi:predicted GIY-YIG superfamily endonuclease